MHDCDAEKLSLVIRNIDTVKIVSSIAILENKYVIKEYIKKMLTTEANWSKVYKLNPLCSHSHLRV